MIMKYACALALVATAVTAFSIPQSQQTALKDQTTVLDGTFLIELNPGETRWVTEDEKWALRRVRRRRSTLHMLANIVTTGRA